jgi:hypothetical protein
MSHTLLDDLGTGLGEFESTLEASRTGRRDHGVAISCRLQRRLERALEIDVVGSAAR